MNVYKNTLIALFSLMILSPIFGENLFEHHILYWPGLIAAILIIIAVLTFPFTNFQNFIANIYMAAFLLVSSFALGITYISIKGYPPGNPPLPVKIYDECNHIVWQYKIDGSLYLDTFTGTKNKWIEEEKRLRDIHGNKFRFSGFYTPQECQKKWKKDISRGRTPRCQ